MLTFGSVIAVGLPARQTTTQAAQPDEPVRVLKDGLPDFVPQGRVLDFEFGLNDLRLYGRFSKGVEALAVSLLEQIRESRQNLVSDLHVPFK